MLIVAVVSTLHLSFSLVFATFFFYLSCCHLCFSAWMVSLYLHEMEAAGDPAATSVFSKVMTIAKCRNIIMPTTKIPKVKGSIFLPLICSLTSWLFGHHHCLLASHTPWCVASDTGRSLGGLSEMLVTFLVCCEDWFLRAF